MRSKITVFFILALSCSVLAQPVAQVQELHGEKKLYLQESKGTPWYRSYVEQNAEIGNNLKTDAQSMASLRFFLGGKVGLGKDCEIEIISERDVKSRSIHLKKGKFWAKFDKQKAPIRIHTAGGVMGIRGTEFLLEVAENGDTQLSLVEGSVEIAPKVGETLLAEPGMKVSFGPEQALIYQIFEDVDKLLEEVREEVGPAFYQLRESLDETRQALRDTKVQVRAAAIEAKTGMLEARAGALIGQEALIDAGIGGAPRDSLNSGQATIDRLDQLLARWEDGGSEPDKTTAPPLPAGSLPILSAFPSLQWQDLQSPKYAVLFLNEADDSIVHWVGESPVNSYSYPSDAKPLEPGKYRVRVLPLSAEDQVMAEGLEFHFKVEG